MTAITATMAATCGSRPSGPVSSSAPPAVASSAWSFADVFSVATYSVVSGGAWAALPGEG